MNRLFSLTICLLTVLFTLFPASGRAGKVIFETISIIDPSSIGFNIGNNSSGDDVNMENAILMFGAMAMFTGQTTITDEGSGNYRFVATMQKDVVLDFKITSPKVVSNSRIEFFCPKDDMTMIITPKNISIGPVSISVVSEAAFPTLLKNLGGVKKSSNSSGKGKSNKHTQKPTPQKKTYKNDPALLKLLTGPMGLAPANPLAAGLQSWRDVLKKGGVSFEESVGIGIVWLERMGKTVSILGNAAECYLKINVNEVETQYNIKDKTRSQADAIYEDLVETLKASGVKLQPDIPSENFPLQSVGTWGDYKIDVHVYKQKEGNFWVSLKSCAERAIPASESATYIDKKASPGANMFGIPGLKITAPVEEIEEQFKLKLIPGEISGNRITTYGRQGPCLLKIPMKGVEKCYGLKAWSVTFYNDDRDPYYYAAFELWTQDNEKFYGKENDKIYQTLFDDIIASLKAEGKAVKKVSAKDLKPFGFQKDAKAVWMVDYGSYRDYYLLTKESYSKTIYMISVQNK